MKKNIEKFRKGYMDMLLLHVLSEGDCYGYEIICIFRKASNKVIDITAGSIYQVFKRLQAQGYIVETSRKDPCRVERVYYHITDEGRLALKEMIEDYHLVADATAAILNFHKDEDASTDKAN